LHITLCKPDSGVVFTINETQDDQSDDEDSDSQENDEQNDDDKKRTKNQEIEER